MKKLSIIFSIGVLFLAGCGGNNNNEEGNNQELPGGAVKGGVFRLNEVSDFRNMFPLSVIEAPSQRIGNQIYEGLVRFDQKDLSVVSALAEKFEINEDATSFTFFLRKGVKFHNDECFDGGNGREINAHDFKYCFTRLCTASPDNLLSALFLGKVKGAEEYYNSTIQGNPLEAGVTGITVVDDYTLRIDLNYPLASFINTLAHPGCWLFAKEAYEKYGVEMRIKCIGTGAFMVKNIKEGEAVILERNPDYWRKDQHGNQLPYLDAIKVTFSKEKKTELQEFRKKNLDMVFELPLEMIDDVVGELEDAKAGNNTPFEMQVTPSMAVQFLAFQTKSKTFNDRRVRQALNYAVDKDKLVTFTLKGDGQVGNYGIVPPAFKGYEYDSIVGYSFNPEKAKDLSSQAGFPNGKGFPKLKLQLNSGGSNNILIAEVVQSMIKENLNIDVELDVMTFPQHIDNFESGKASFWKAGWVADYPDPENFLNLLYGWHVPDDMNEKSYVNHTRYQNSTYDSLFDMALRTVDVKERYRLYRMAEQVAVNDAPFLVLYYAEFTRLLQKNVKNFPANAMEYRDFSEVYFKDEK